MAYKSFTNGFPLPASDLNNYLMNQAVITFASATERDATLTSPTEGMLTYLADTDVYTWYNGTAWANLVSGGTPIDESLLTTTGDMIYASAAETAARLGIGSEGDVLTVTSGVPAWETPAGAGTTTWTDLGSVTPTPGVSFITISGLTGYNKYVIEFLLRANAAASFTGVAQSQTITKYLLETLGDASSSKMALFGGPLAEVSSSSSYFAGFLYLEFNPATGLAHYIQNTGSTGTTATDKNYTGNYIGNRPNPSYGISITGSTLMSGSYKVYGGN